MGRVPETRQTVHQTQTETAVTQQKITDYELTMTHQTLQYGGGEPKNTPRTHRLASAPARALALTHTHTHAHTRTHTHTHAHTRTHTHLSLIHI